MSGPPPSSGPFQDRLDIARQGFAALVAGSSIASEKAGVTAMRNIARLPDTSELSYLDASKVTSPAGVLSELDVLSAEGRRLGSIEGVVIDAAARHVRYLSVRCTGWFGRRRYLVQADQLGQIDTERNALRLRADLRDDAVHGLDVGALRKFSDDDLLAAMFAPRAA